VPFKSSLNIIRGIIAWAVDRKSCRWVSVSGSVSNLRTRMTDRYGSHSLSACQHGATLHVRQRRFAFPPHFRRLFNPLSVRAFVWLSPNSITSILLKTCIKPLTRLSTRFWTGFMSSDLLGLFL